MSDAEGWQAPTPAAVETVEARIYLLNGLNFGVNVPVDAEKYSVWLKVIKADGALLSDDLVIPYAAIACIVRGPILEQMQRLTMMQLGPTGRPN